MSSRRSRMEMRLGTKIALTLGLAWLAACGRSADERLVCARTPSGMAELQHVTSGRVYGSPVFGDVCERLRKNGGSALVCAPIPSGLVQLTNVDSGLVLGEPLAIELCEKAVGQH